MRGLNVVAVNVMKTSWKHYRVYVTPLTYDKEAPRKVQTTQLSMAYARELERMVRHYPEQWYNFYAFWN
jgi:predicted LPLAT superfamily acyltransferase